MVGQGYAEVSAIITSTRGLSDLDQVAADPLAASTNADLQPDEAIVLSIDGHSYRMGAHQLAPTRRRETPLVR